MSETKVMIALMGPTGTGKSTFINLLTEDEGIRVGHDLDSQTLDINMASYDQADRHITLVDTPGFDDSREGVTDTDILDKIATFLQAEGGRMLNGVIYLHRISDPRMGGIAKKNLRMFRELCGDKNLNNVRIATTHWSTVDKREAGVRQKELANGAFKSLIEGGAKLIAHDKGAKSARAIVSDLIQKTPIKLQIQEELDEGRVLADTSAGVVILEGMKEMQQKHEEEMEDLKREMAEAITANNQDLEAELAEERRKLEKVMAQVEEDRQRMEVMRLVQDTLAEQEWPIDENMTMALGAPNTSLTPLAQDFMMQDLPHHDPFTDANNLLVDTSTAEEATMGYEVTQEPQNDMEAVMAKTKDLEAQLEKARQELVELKAMFEERRSQHDIEKTMDEGSDIYVRSGKGKSRVDKGKGVARSSRQTYSYNLPKLRVGEAKPNVVRAVRTKREYRRTHGSRPSDVQWRNLAFVVLLIILVIVFFCLI